MNKLCSITNSDIIKGIQNNIDLQNIQQSGNLDQNKKLFLEAMKKYFETEKTLTKEVLDKFTDTYFTGNVRELPKNMFLRLFGIDVDTISSQEIINLYPKHVYESEMMRSSKEFRGNEKLKNISVYNSNQLFLKYYNNDIERVFEYMKKLAGRGIFNASICARDAGLGISDFGQVNNSTTLNINMMLFKQYLFSNIIEYLYNNRSLLKSQNHIDFVTEQYNKFFNNGLRVRLTTRVGDNYYADRGLFEAKKDNRGIPGLEIIESGILEIDLFLDAVNDVLLNLYEQLTKAINLPNTPNNTSLILAYNSYVILTEFDNVVLPMLTNNRIYVRPTYLNSAIKNLINRYNLSSKTNVILDNFRTEDPNVEEETDPIIKLAIQSLPRMEFGLEYNSSLLYDSLSFTDYTNVISLIKLLSVNTFFSNLQLSKMINMITTGPNGKPLDNLLLTLLLNEGYIHEVDRNSVEKSLFEQNGKQFNIDNSKDYTIGELVTMITKSPKKYSHLIFNLLCAPSFYSTFKDYLFLHFTKKLLDNLYSIYYNVFNTSRTNDIQSYYTLTKNNTESFYSYLALNIATIYPAVLLQTYMDRGLVWSIRDFLGKEVENYLQLMKTDITFYNTIKFNDILEHYNLLDLMFNENDGTLSLATNDGNRIVFKIKSGDKIDLKNTDIHIQMSNSDILMPLFGNLTLLTSQDLERFLPLLDKILTTTFSEDNSLKNFVLKADAKELGNYKNENQRYVFFGHLIEEAMRTFGLNYLFQKDLVQNSMLTSRRSIEDWITRNIGDTKTEKHGILYDSMTNSISLVYNTSLLTLKNLSRLILDYNNSFVKSQVNDSLLNGQSVISLSRLIGSHLYQFMDIQGKVDGQKGAASESFIFNENVYRGFAQVKELYTYSGSHKSDELLNTLEFVGLSVLGYLSAFGNLSDQTSKNIGWDGTALFLAAVMSDKKMIGHILVNIFADILKYGIIGKDGNLRTKLSELDSEELLELISKTIGNTYYNILNNIIEDLNNLTIEGLSIPLGLDYLTGFNEINKLYGNNSYSVISNAITEYNNKNQSHPIKFTEELHFVKNKNGSISINKSFLANVVRWSNTNTLTELLKHLSYIPQYQVYSNEGVFERITNTLRANNVINENDSLVDRKAFLLMKNIEMLEDLLSNGYKLNIEHNVLSKEYDTYTKMFSEWFDTDYSLAILGKISLKIDGNNITVNIKQTADLVDMYYKHIYPYLNKIYNQLNDGQRNILNRILNNFLNIPSVREMVRSLLELNTIFAEPIITNISVNEMFARINMLDYLITLEYLNATVGNLFAHPAKGNSIISDEASRFLALHKRNVQHTAAMQAYAMNLLEGITQNYKVAVIDDIYDIVYNSFGNKETIKPFDGATFVSPFAVHLENKSLGSASVGITKKIFVHSYDKRTASGIIVKTAGFGITNQWMRNDPQLLLTIMKKMTNQVWRNKNGEIADVDITKSFYLDLNTEGKSVVSKTDFLNTLKNNPNIGEIFIKKQDSEGVVHYYNILRIEKSLETPYQYKRVLQEVNKSGLPIGEIGQLVVDYVDNVNSNYNLWLLFGGLDSVEVRNGEMVGSENSIKAVVEAMNYCIEDALYGLAFNKQVTLEDIYLPLKNSDILYLITKGAIKEGAGNVNVNSSYTDDAPLSWFYMNMYLSGVQLDKEHAADDSEISLMTQVISACAARGYTFNRAVKLYKSLSLLTHVGIANFLDPFLGIYQEKDPSKINMFKLQFDKEFNSLIVETLAEKDITSSNFATKLATQILDRIKNNQEEKIEDQVLPISDNAFYNQIVSAINIALTKFGIKQIVNGSLAVMTPSFNIMKLYNGKLYDQVVREAESLNKTVQLYMQEIQDSVIPVKHYINNEDGTVSLEINISALKIGRTYIIRNNDTNEVQQVFLTPDNYNLVYNTIINDNVYVVEDISNGRDLGTYCVYFNDAKTNQLYSIWSLDSVLKLRGLTLTKDFYESKEYKSFIDIYNRYYQNGFDLLNAIELANNRLIELDNNIKLNLQIINDTEILKQIPQDLLTEDQLLLISLYDIEKDSRINAINRDTKDLSFYLFIYDNLIKIKQLKDEYLSYTGNQNSLYTFKEMIDYLTQLYKMDFLNDMSLLTKDEYEDIQDLFERFVLKCRKEYKDEQTPDNISNAKQRFYDKLYLAIAYLTKTKLSLLKNSFDNPIALRPTNPFNVLYKNALYKNAENITIGEYIDSIINEDVRSNNTELNNEVIDFIISKAQELLYKRSHVYINNTPISIDRNSITTDDYEVVMPKTAATNFGLREFDSVENIVNDQNFFINRIKENFATPAGMNSNVASVELKTFTGLHYFILDADLIVTDLNIKDVTDNFIQEIKSDGRKILLDKNNLIVFELFNRNDKVFLKKNLKGENLYIILTSNMANYIDNMSYNYINILTTNENIVNKIYNAVINSDNHIAEMFAESYKLVGYKDINDTQKLLDKNSLLNHDRIDDKGFNYYEDHINSVGHKMYASFRHYLDIVAARIPAQSMQSFMKMKIAAFENKNINNAYVSTMQLWLEGSDYDIDSVNLVTYNINRNGMLDIHSPYARIDSVEEILKSFELPFPTGEKVSIGILNEGETENDIDDVIKFYQKYLPLFEYTELEYTSSNNKTNVRKALRLRKDADLDLLKDLLSEKVVPTFNKNLYFNDFAEETGYELTIKDIDNTIKDIAKVINKHNLYLLKLSQTDYGTEKIERIALNNMQYSMLQIASDPANLLLSQAPLDEITGLAKDIASKSDKSNEQKTRTPGNFVNKYLSIEENAVGKACIGINAIGMKTYFYLTLYYNSILNNGTKEEQERLLYKMLFDNKESSSNKFGIRGYSNNDYNIRLLPQVRCKDINTINSYEVLYNLGLMNYANDVALDESVLISLSADNAKELVLAKLCINPKTNGMVIAGLLSGLSFSEIADLFMSPAGDLIINMSKSDLFNLKNDTSSTNMDNIFSNIENIRIPNNLQMSQWIYDIYPTISFKEVLFSEFLAERFVRGNEQYYHNNGNGKTHGLDIYNIIIKNDLENIYKIDDSLGSFINAMNSNTNINTWGSKQFFETLFGIYNSNTFNVKEMMRVTMTVLDRVFNTYFNKTKNNNANLIVKIKTNRIQQNLRNAFYNYSLIHGTDTINKYNQIKRLYKISKILFDLGRLCSLNQGLPPNVKGLLNLLHIFDKYNIDVLLFATNLDYVNKLISEWDNKNDSFINIPDFMSKSEVLYKYILALATSEEYSKKSTRFRTIRQLSDNVIRHEMGKSENDVLTEQEMKTYDFMRTKMADAIELFVMDHLKNEWMYDYFSREENLIRLPKGAQVFNGYGELVKLSEDSEIILGNDFDNATIRKYIEDVIIPNLKSLEIENIIPLNDNEGLAEYNNRISNIKLILSNNDVIKKLQYKPFNKTLSKNTTLIYTLPINMQPRSKDESGKALLILYLNSLSALKDVVLTLGNLKINVPDLLFLYTMLSLDLRLGESTLTNLFSAMESNIRKNYYDYIGESDKNLDNEIIFGKNVPYEALLPYYIKTGSIYYSYDNIILSRNLDTGLFEYFKNIKDQESISYNLLADSEEEGIEISEEYDKTNERFIPFDVSDYDQLGLRKVRPRYFPKGIVGVKNHYIVTSNNTEYEFEISVQKRNKSNKTDAVITNIKIKDTSLGFLSIKDGDNISKYYEEDAMAKILYDKYLKKPHALKSKFKAIKDEEGRISLLEVYDIDEILDNIENEEACNI